mmetsp:Transcript_1026/g.2357  ORF Transcript_1026/g.2357 Transcript_1026/m.2357 type:complete len:243 (+) Transcript_1026:11-739(+)
MWVHHSLYSSSSRMLLRTSLAVAMIGAATAFSGPPSLRVPLSTAPAGCSASPARAIPANVAAFGVNVGLQQRGRVPLLTALSMTAAEKESPLEAGGLRGLEEEERRIGMWRQRFELSDEQIGALRANFDKALESSAGDLRVVDKESMKKLIESVNVELDMANVVKEGDRPVVSEGELQNYIDALKDLWEEACQEDAVEVANGECFVPLDTEKFDLSEVAAVYGMCVRDHCGIGGVCFWDSDE